MKQIFMSLSLLLLSLGVTSTAVAADWQPISKSVAEREEYFLDLDSVKIRQGRLSGNVLTNYARNRFEAASAQDLYSVDCQARNISHLSGGTFSEPYAQGKSVSQYVGRSPTPEAIQAGTTGERILIELCKAKPVP